MCDWELLAAQMFYLDFLSGLFCPSSFLWEPINLSEVENPLLTQVLENPPPACAEWFAVSMETLSAERDRSRGSVWQNKRGNERRLSFGRRAKSWVSPHMPWAHSSCIETVEATGDRKCCKSSSEVNASVSELWNRLLVCNLDNEKLGLTVLSFLFSFLFIIEMLNGNLFTFQCD